MRIASKMNRHFLLCAIASASLLAGCGSGTALIAQPNSGDVNGTSAVPSKSWTAVDDSYLLKDLPKDSFAQLIVGKALQIAQPTHRSLGRGNTEIHPLAVAGGRFLQDVSDQAPCVDVETGNELAAAGCTEIVDGSECRAWWTPVAEPSSQDSSSEDGKDKAEASAVAATSAVWGVEADRVFPIKRSEFSDGLLLHADHGLMYENQLSLRCKGVAEESLTVGHLRKAFGGGSVVKILK